MNFIDHIKEGANIVKLDKKAIRKIAKDRKATNAGIIILLIAGLLSVVGLYNIEGYYQVLIMAPLFMLVFFVLGTGLLHVFVRLFGGQATYPELFRVLSHSSVICWLWLFVMVPVIGNIINTAILIWGIVMTVIAVEAINNMSRTRALLAVLVPFVIAAIVVFTVVYLQFVGYVPA